MFSKILQKGISSIENNTKILWGVLIVIILLGLIPRIWGFLKFPHEFYGNDGLEYRDISEQLYKGNGFSVSIYRWYEASRPGEDRTASLHTDFSRPPLFPLLGALLYCFPFDWESSAKITCLLLSAACSVAVFLLGKEIFGKTTGVLAAMVYTFYPYAIYYSICWSSENLFILLLVLGMLFLFQALRKGYSPLHAALSGLCSGLLVLTRPQGFVFLPLLLAAAFVFLLFRKTARNRFFITACSFAIAALLALLPWMIRNYRVAGIPSPLTFYGPYSFCQASSEIVYLTYKYLDTPEYTGKTDAEWDRFHDEKITFLAEHQIFSLLEANPYWTRWAWDYIYKNPQKMAYIIFFRILHWFRACPNLIIIPDSIILLLRSYFTVFVILMLSGIWFARKNYYALALMVPPLCGLAMAVPFLMVLRYRYPFFAPFAAILAAYGFYRILLFFMKKSPVQTSLQNNTIP